MENNVIRIKSSKYNPIDLSGDTLLEARTEAGSTIDSSLTSDSREGIIDLTDGSPVDNKKKSKQNKKRSGDTTCDLDFVTKAPQRKQTKTGVQKKTSEKKQVHRGEQRNKAPKNASDPENLYPQSPSQRGRASRKETPLKTRCKPGEWMGGKTRENKALQRTDKG